MDILDNELEEFNRVTHSEHTLLSGNFLYVYIHVSINEPYEWGHIGHTCVACNFCFTSSFPSYFRFIKSLGL